MEGAQLPSTKLSLVSSVHWPFCKILADLCTTFCNKTDLQGWELWLGAFLRNASLRAYSILVAPMHTLLLTVSPTKSCSSTQGFIALSPTVVAKRKRQNVGVPTLACSSASSCRKIALFLFSFSPFNTTQIVILSVWGAVTKANQLTLEVLTHPWGVHPIQNSALERELSGCLQTTQVHKESSQTHNITMSLFHSAEW